MSKFDRPSAPTKAVRRSASLYLVFLLVLAGFAQQVAFAETRPESPGEQISDGSNDIQPTQPSEQPPAQPPAAPTQPPASGPDPTQVPAEIPTVPVENPTEIPTEPPFSTDVPTIPSAEPTLPDLDPTMTVEETPEPEPTQRPANVDDLVAYDVASGITLGPGESGLFTYTYVVSTSRIATTLTGGLSGETAGWSIQLYAGNSASGLGLEVSISEASALRAGDAFEVTVVIAAPVESTQSQTVSFWISAIATPDDGASNEAGASTTGPSLSFAPPVMETPTPTETPTPAASPTAEPSPTPTVTPEPSIPFAPILTCAPLDRASEAGAISAWGTQLCSVTWETRDVISVNAAVLTEVEGWVAVAVDPSGSLETSALESSGNSLDLVNAPASDSGFLGGQFVIGTKADCHAESAATINVEFTATSTVAIPPTETMASDEVGIPTNSGDPAITTLIEIVTQQIAGTAATPTLPVLTLSAASFEPIDISDERKPSIGTVQVDFAGADPACGWQITLSYDAFSDGDISIPITAMEFMELTGLEQAVTSFDQGVLIITIPAGSNLGSGSFVVTTSLDIPVTVQPGTYSTTITAGVLITP